MAAQKIALVTGAGSGVGKAAALALSRDGFTVVLAGRRADKLHEVAGELDGAYARRADRRARARLDRGFVRQDERGLRPARPSVQQCRRQHARHADRGDSAGALAGGGRHQSHRLVPVHAGSDQDHEGARPARRPHHQQRLDFRAHAAAGHRAYTATKHAITGLTKQTALDCRAYDICCGQIDIGNAATPLTEKMATGMLQADGRIMPEARMNVDDVGRAVAYMASLPLDANVLFMTVMANKMPFVGRG